MEKNEAVLALIADLYAQLNAAQHQVVDQQAQLAAAQQQIAALQAQLAAKAPAEGAQV